VPLRFGSHLLSRAARIFAEPGVRRATSYELRAQAYFETACAAMAFPPPGGVVEPLASPDQALAGLSAYQWCGRGGPPPQQCEVACWRRHERQSTPLGYLGAPPRVVAFAARGARMRCDARPAVGDVFAASRTAAIGKDAGPRPCQEQQQENTVGHLCALHLWGMSSLASR